MAILKDLAQVLRVYEQGNTSLVAVMLGRRLGQFRVHIKGGRRWPKKGFEGGFDLLSRGEILVYPRAGGNLWLFKEWDEQVRPQLGRSLALLNAASYLCELTEALTRQTAGAAYDPALLDAHGGSAALLYDSQALATDALASGAQPGPVLLIFTLRALDAEGFLPQLDSCDTCGQDLLKAGKSANGRAAQPVWLSAHGLRCRQCLTRQHAIAKPVSERGVWLSPEAHRAMIHIAGTGRAVRVSAPAAGQLARALTVLVHGALEHDLHTLQAAARLVGEMAGRGMAKKMERMR